MCLDQNCLKNKQELGFKIGFWTMMAAFLAICSFFMIHNAWWTVSDEAIVVEHVGMGKAFSPLGFPEMVSQGRLYPLAYSLYNILLLFNNGYLSPSVIYILHSIALSIYAIFFALIGLHTLKEKPAIWKYGITYCLVIIAVVRVLQELITCLTGVWIVYLFIPIFLYCVIRFDKSEHWGWGIAALLSINYIMYCYENVCTIPFAIGACSLLFNYKNLNRNKKIFNALLIAGVLVFFGIWVLVILPQVSQFYSHKEESSLFANALRIFIAQKIYWIASIVLLYRVYQYIFKKSAYTIYDSLLLAAFALFVGTAVLKLNFIYYYNIGVLIALVAILYYGNKYLKPQWVGMIFLMLTLFYGRKFPRLINQAQKDRVENRELITYLSDETHGVHIYWYAPYYEDINNLMADERNCQRKRLMTIMKWYKQGEDVLIEEMQAYDSSKEGVWLFPKENEKLFSDYEDVVDMERTIRTTRVFPSRL